MMPATSGIIVPRCTACSWRRRGQLVELHESCPLQAAVKRVEESTHGSG